jgi:hypothetical protein
MWLFLAVVDVVPALKQLLSDRDEHQETFRQAIRVMWSKLLYVFSFHFIPAVGFVVHLLCLLP